MKEHVIRAYLDPGQMSDLNRLERMVPVEFTFLLWRVLDGYVEVCVQRDALVDAAMEASK